jgi:hypothetical protein
MCGTLRTIGAAILVLCAFTTDADANTLVKSATSAGATSASGNYRLGATLAEAGVVGRSASGNAVMIAGFWMPSMSLPTSVPATPSAPAAPPVPSVNRLFAVAPNPVIGSAAIAFTLARDQAATLVLYDVSGRRVRVLAEGLHASGRHQVSWDGRDEAGRRVASGIYFLRLNADGWTARERVLIVH